MAKPVTIPIQSKERFFDELIAQVGECFEPEEIFPRDVLEQWAEDNGYVQAE